MYSVEDECIGIFKNCSCFGCLKELDSRIQYFNYKHLPPRLQEVSKQYYNVAAWILMNTPISEQRALSLQKLLESKDCAVRTAL